jgi:TetR/AcrR family transcriptional regulator, transcriptional repressor for nem operon
MMRLWFMPRPVEFDKREVLEKAMDVFWEKGFEAASLQDLTDSMGLSKSSFYNTFDSKHQLFSEALSLYNSCMTDPLSRAVENSTSGLDFIRSLFDQIVELSGTSLGNKGCFLMNTATEFAQQDPEIAKVVDSGFGRFERILLKAIIKAQEKGEIAREKDPQTLACYLVCSMSGLKTMVRAGIKPSKLRHIVSTILAAIE